jgi:hypothetical protein
VLDEPAGPPAFLAAYERRMLTLFTRAPAITPGPVATAWQLSGWTSAEISGQIGGGSRRASRHADQHTSVLCPATLPAEPAASEPAGLLSGLTGVSDPDPGLPGTSPAIPTGRSRRWQMRQTPWLL